MKTSLKSGLLFAASLLAFVSISSAQVLTDYETQTSYGGSVSNFSASGGAATKGEVFTNVISVQKMTYNFFIGTSGSTSAATNLTATFGEWNGSAFVGGTTVSFGTITIPASTDVSWSNTLTNPLNTNTLSIKNFAYEFDLRTLAPSGGLISAVDGYITTASKSYALMLTNTTGSSTNLGLGINDSDSFSYGYRGTSLSGEDFVFSQISVTPNPIVPESSTIAAILGCTLVAALVGFRLRQQRQLTAAPAVQTVA